MHTMYKSIRFSKSINFFQVARNISNEDFKENKVVKVSSYYLKIMDKSIINNKKLKCDQSHVNKHITPAKALLVKNVNKRTKKCDSYLKSLYKVIYPGGINPRKK